VLLLTLSVVVPVMEQGSLFDRPVVEREHEPGECPSGHDHTICTQMGANLSLEAAPVESPFGPTAVSVLPIARNRALSSGPLDGSKLSRAPPLA
jgi:hypothetical protein